MRELLFVSLEDWDDVWRRNQFVCAALAARGWRVLFVGLPRNVSHALRHGRLRSLLRPGTYSAPGVPDVTVTHPWKLLPDTLPGGRAVNQWLFRRHVKHAARRMDFDRPVLWLNPHAAGHMAGRTGEAAVVYDVTDDWTQMSQSAAQAKRVVVQDAALCAKADAIIVCSERLAELKRPLNAHVHLIPNGVDAAHYAGVLDAAGPVPAVAAGWKRPVLGYTGTVHPDRVDVELVRDVALAWPGSVVLVGPDHLRAEDVARLDLPNVHRVGPIAYAEVPVVMRAFDVCIVPHRMSAFVESLNPIKLWEYLAAGKPIVSTDVAGFRDFPRLVRLVRTAQEFVAAAHAAVAEAHGDAGRKFAEERRVIARANSWQRRVDEIVRVIDDSLQRRDRAGGPKIHVDAKQLPVSRSLSGDMGVAECATRVSVVIVSYNTRDLTLRCLAELFANAGGLALDVFVVDNGSADNSVGAVRQNCPQVRVIALDGNVGFGAANNRALSEVSGDYVLLLNSDALVRPGAIEAMVDVLRQHARVGAVGCRLDNADGSLQRSCWNFPTPARAWAEAFGLRRLGAAKDWHWWDHAAESDVDFIIGAALMVRREVIEQVGGFDEAFFLYAEETDWQRRMQDAGWRVRYTPAGTVVHLGGASGQGMRSRQLVEFCRGNARYIQKHHGRIGLAVLRGAKVVGLTLRLIAASGLVLVGRAGAREAARERVAHLRWWLGVGPREGIQELAAHPKNGSVESVPTAERITCP